MAFLYLLVVKDGVVVTVGREVMSLQKRVGESLLVGGQQQQQQQQQQWLLAMNDISK
jgi:hypothetical protein